MHNGVVRKLIATLLLIGLSGCSGGPDRGSVEAAMAGSLSRVISEREYPLVVTQAEFQDSQRGLSWVVQYQDPLETPEATAHDTSLLMFEAPLESLVLSVREHESDMRDMGVDTFFVAFRGDSTVYELSAELIWEYVEGDADWEDVASRMMISG